MPCLDRFLARRSQGGITGLIFLECIPRLKRSLRQALLALRDAASACLLPGGELVRRFAMIWTCIDAWYTVLLV